MAVRKARAGVVYMFVNGLQYDLKGNIKISPLTVERESITGPSGYIGFKETPKAASVEGEFVRNPNISIAQLQSFTDITVTVEFVDGVSYVLRNAACMTAVEIDGVEGTYTAKFEGPDIQEVGIGGI